MGGPRLFSQKILKYPGPPLPPPIKNVPSLTHLSIYSIILIWSRLHDRWGTRQGGYPGLSDRVTLSAEVFHVNVSRWGNPPSQCRIRDTSNSLWRSLCIIVEVNNRKPQHWRLQQEQQVSVEEHKSPKHVVCKLFVVYVLIGSCLEKVHPGMAGL